MKYNNNYLHEQLDLGEGKTVKDFIQELESTRQSLLEDIEAKCAGFDISEKASKKRVKQAQKNFAYFCANYFPHYIDSKPSIFHQWIFDNIPAAIDNKDGYKYAIAAPRGNAKSTILTQLFTLWCVITGRKHFVVIIMDAFDQAATMLEAVKAELEGNIRLKQDFPTSFGAGRIWQAGMIITSNNCKIQAAGAKKKLRGLRHGAYRPDLVLLDDIENDEQVRRKEQRDQLESWIDKVALKLGPPGGSMDALFVGTILHHDSVLNRKLNNAVWLSKLFQAVITWPNRMELWEQWEQIYIDDGKQAAAEFFKQNKSAMQAGSVVLWQEVQPIEKLMEKRLEGHKSFDSEYQNNPSSETALFKELHYWEELPDDLVFFGTVDPSMGKLSKNSDPCAILVGAISRKTGKLYLVEAIIAKLKPNEIIKKVIEFQRKYNCLKWAIEINQFQEFFKDELVNKSTALGVPVPAVGVRASSDKGLRIASLQPHTANGSILLHRRLTILIEQLQHWPEAAHDDGPDALHMLWALAVPSSRGIPQVRTIEKESSDILAGYPNANFY